MAEATSRFGPKILWVCGVALLGGLAEVAAVLRPIWFARRMLGAYKHVVQSLPAVGGQVAQVCDALDFHLLSKCNPAEALAVVERRLMATSGSPFICADYAIAAQLCERLSLRQKALSYYQLARDTAPTESSAFRTGMADRLARIGPER